VTASPTRLLVHLVDAGVDFVVIGAIAVVAHGHIRTTRDLDITYATGRDNLDALGAALVTLDARLRGVTDVVPFVPDGRTLHGAELLTLETTAGSLDLLASPPGAPPYAQLKARAEAIEIESRSVLIASIEDLVAMKRRAGRPRDLEDIEALQELRRMRGEATKAG
jgi:nucleotidyltransferase AbiEii toxin of type IV toxin-antitoxin system